MVRDLLVTTAPKKIEDVRSMFHGCRIFNGDLSKWDVSHVTDMNRMFVGCLNFNGDLSNWDVSKVTDINSMFAEAINFNQHLNKWDVSKVTDMSGMFEYATLFNQPLNKWKLSPNMLIDGLQEFMSRSIDQNNYDATLIGWNNHFNSNQNPSFFPYNINFTNYLLPSNQAAIDAAKNLRDNALWTIK